MKTDTDFFHDWFCCYLGYGYGTGDEHFIRGLEDFFSLLEDGRSYDYRHLEAKLGPPAAWLLINVLCKADIIEYGSSPRFGWISTKGEWLKAFIQSRTHTQLMEATEGVEGVHKCFPDLCQCPSPCNNPLFGPAANNPASWPTKDATRVSPV